MMALSLGFAGGVMLTVSLVDMLPGTVRAYRGFLSPQGATFAAMSLFLSGCVIAWLLQNCLPEPKNLHNTVGVEAAMTLRAAKSAMITTAVILLHNLPEGILTLFTGYGNPSLGLTLTLAIALHNIPEGIAVSVPVYYATGSKMRGLWASLCSGLAEPVGALLAFLLLRRYITPAFLDGLVALIAGIMSFVSYRELLPGSLDWGEDGAAVAGMVGGTIIMSIGIFLL
ncbi:MAG: ZIP family metal transporter, partial [Pygmaiobacter sp.]